MATDDCMACCLAVLLDVPRESVPSPDPMERESFWATFRGWADGLGLRLVFHGTEYGRSFPESDRWIAVAPSFAHRHSQHGHAIVMDGQRLLYDPNTNKPRKRRPTKILFGLTLRGSSDKSQREEQ